MLEVNIDFVEVSWTQGAFITTISEAEVLRYIEKKNKALEGFKKILRIVILMITGCFLLFRIGLLWNR